MRIATVEQQQLSSERRFIAGRETHERLRMQQDGVRLDAERHTRVEVQHSSQASVSVKQDASSAAPLALQVQAQSPAALSRQTLASAAEPEAVVPSDEALRKLKMLLIALGHSVEHVEKTLASVSQGISLPSTGASAVADVPVSNGDFFNYQYDVTEWRGESLSIQASGRVSTADGRRIEYGLSLEMLQLQYSSSSVSVQVGTELTDPLVLNLGGGPVTLNGQQRTAFDLNADGKLDSIASLSSHSAFLALDRNGNGQIDNGRELFGAISGDGFAELEAYDEDGNGFIDESDSIFHKLKLWRPDASGKGELVDLLTAGVGAIGLARAYADFDVLAAGQLEGRIRSTGLFFFESGQVSSVQQIDLAI